MEIVCFLIIGALCALALFLYFKFFKLYKVKNIVFIDGSLGTGKSFLSVSMAIRLWKRNKRRYKVRLFFITLFSFIPRFKSVREDMLREGAPLLYSNILLSNVPFVKVTKELMTRDGVRFVKRSVLLIDESSLMADQMMYKDDKLNEQLTLFWKLFRHETCGGNVVVNSQSTSDLHYSIKYVLSDYLYIHHRLRLPFISILKVQEMAYCADKGGNNIMNVMNDDIETNLRSIVVFNKYFKMYDSCCFSIFSDDYEIIRDVREYEKGDSLKDMELVSFREYRFLRKNDIVDSSKVKKGDTAHGRA